MPTSRLGTTPVAPRRIAWTPLAVLVVGAACTAIVVQQLAAAGRERDRQRFENVAHRLQVGAEYRVDSYRDLLRATARMLAGHDGYAEPAHFHRFLEAVRPSDYPGVEGVGYCRRLGRTELEAFAAEARRRIDPAFEVTPADPPRPEYYPVVLIDPAGPPDRRELGFDPGSDPACRAAIQRAVDTGLAVASAPVTGAPLLRDSREQDGAVRAGLVIFAPVYKKDARPADPAARREALRGLAYVAAPAAELFAGDPRSAGAGGAGGWGDAEFIVRDGPADAAPLYHSRGYASAAARDARFTTALPVAVAGRTWTLTAVSTPAFEARAEPGPVLGAGPVAAGGSAVTLLLAGLTWLQVRARATAGRAARDAVAAAGRLDLVLGASGVGLCHRDLPSGRLNWDERAKALFFLAGEASVTTDTALRRVHPDDRELLRRAVDQSALEMAPFDVGYRTVSPDGLRTNWLRSVGRPATDAAGVFSRFDVLTTDVTALKQAIEQAEAARTQAESALAQAEAARAQAEASRAQAEASRAQAEGASRVKDEFLATLSHELRTPLNAVLGWAQLLRRGPGLDPSVEEGLVVIERNARVQAQLVSDLLDMSRILAGKMRLEVGPVDLAAVAAEAVESIRPAAEAKGIAVERVAPEATAAGVTVWGDAARLQQVAWNLLTNAVKFTPEGGRVRVVVASPAGPGGPVTLTVSDTGGGIDAAFLPHLFDRFSQAEGGAARRHGGLGLGLAVVKHLVELHGGRVSAASGGPGAGSTFTVELPAARVPAAAEAPAAPAAHAPQGRPAAGALAGLSVLVVDDEPDARELARRVLTQAGATVLTACDADEALGLVRDRRPDVLVGDIGMPGRDGFALARAVRALPAGQGGATPAVALTAFAGAEDGRRVLAAGYHVHLPKPAESADLVAVVAGLAGRGAAGPNPAAPATDGDSRPEAASTRRERLGLDG